MTGHSHNTPALSVVIPAYNEERRLPAYLDQILSYLKQGSLSWEVLVVDDGSSDGTSPLVRHYSAVEPRVRLITLPKNCGKGCAVRTGMLAATGQLRLFTDADGATPISEVERLMAQISDGADAAVASRAVHAPGCTVRGKAHRKVIGTAFNLIVRTLTVRAINDTQCGFKLFSAAAATAAFPLQRIDDFGFDVEILYILKKKGFRIAEVPVNWTDVAGSKVRLWHDSLQMFKDLVQIRMNDWRGAYPKG